MVLRGTIHTSLILHCVHTHTHTLFSDVALLDLMVMCFMSVPCCGSMSQTERLTNCSILLNVRLIEAINGSELIAVTHLAPCHHALPFTTSADVEHMSDSGSFVWSVDRWIATESWKTVCHFMLCCVLNLWTHSSLRTSPFLPLLSHSSTSSHWSETWDTKTVSCCYYCRIVEEESACMYVRSCLCVKREVVVELSLISKTGARSECQSD